MADLPNIPDRMPQVKAPTERSLPIPRVETPHLETPRLETPRIDAARIDAPRLEAPHLEQPRYETPRLETPQLAQFPSSLRDVASLMDTAGKEATAVAKVMAVEAGYKSVTRDEDGNIKVDKLPIIGDAAIPYQHAIQVKAITDGDAVAKSDLLDLRQKFPDDPEGFRKAAAEYRNTKVKQLEDVAGAAVGTSVGKAIDTTALETYRGLLNRKETDDLNKAQSSVMTQIATATNELFALKMGGMDDSSPDIQSRLQKVGALWGQLAANPRFGVSRERVEYAVTELQSQLYVAGMGGLVEQVQKEQGPTAAMEMVDRTLSDPSLNFTQAQRQQYKDRLQQDIRQRVNQNIATNNGIDGEISALLKVGADGFGLPPERVARVQQAVDASRNPSLIARFNDVKTILPILANIQRGGPAEVEAALSRFSELARVHGDSEDQIALRTGLRHLLTNMRTDIKNDPLDSADRRGAVTVPKIDFSAPNAAEQMRDRIAKADLAASINGGPTTYLFNTERTMLTSLAAKGGGDTLGVARTIVEGFGDRAPKVLAELGKDSPILAHLGGLMITGASPAFLRDAAEAVALKQNHDFKHPRWLDSDNGKIVAAQHERTADVFGRAFFLESDAGRAAEMAAQSAFYTRSYRLGYDPMFVAGTDPGGAKKAYDRALQESAGAVYDAKDVRYGGVEDYKTGTYGFRTVSKVLVPPNIRADSFGDVIGALTDRDIAGAVTSDGRRAVTATELRRAIPVAVAGGYRFALGDPTGDSPQWIVKGGGQPFVLNLDRLEPVLRRRVPDAYAGSAR